MLTSAARRRVFGEYQSTEPSRFLDEIPAELVERIAPASSPRYQSALRARALRVPDQSVRPQGHARRGSRKREATYAYEDEDQSATGVRPGMRVRHAQFGVGTVIAVEEHNDDLKITVRFNIGRREEAAGEVREARAGVGVGSARTSRAQDATCRSSDVAPELAREASRRSSLGVGVARRRRSPASSSFSAQLRDRDDLVALFHLDQPDALRGAADDADVAGLHAQDHALLR